MAIIKFYFITDEVCTYYKTSEFLIEQLSSFLVATFPQLSQNILFKNIFKLNQYIQLFYTILKNFI